ncbi:MAG: hypothetical protein QF412_11475 [Planctomycetota bacterium]|nr:hypothetical protein [Planctomycetota bacterium]
MPGVLRYHIRYKLLAELSIDATHSAMKNLSTMITLLALLATLPFWSNGSSCARSCFATAGTSPCCAPMSMADGYSATSCCSPSRDGAPADRDLPPCQCDDGDDIPWNLPPVTPHIAASIGLPANFTALAQPIEAAVGVRPCPRARACNGPPLRLRHCVFLI